MNRDFFTTNYRAIVKGEHLLSREPLVFDIFGPGVGIINGSHPTCTAENLNRMKQFTELLQAAFDQGYTWGKEHGIAEGKCAPR